MSDEYGGPAFPTMHCDANFNHEWEEAGMYLRDFLAAQALLVPMPGNPAPADLAKRAYQIADAMLAERSKSS